jgi:hypothetical protein
MDKGQVEDTRAFEKAMRTLRHELPDHMRAWNLSTMVAEVQRLVSTEKTQNRLRSFTRQVLHLSGNQHKRIGAWLRDPSLLTVADAHIVLCALAKMPAPPVAVVPQRIEVTTSNLNRKLVAFVITNFNSLDMLTAEAGITPADAFDGDRMQLRKAMERLCARFGVRAVFSDRSATRSHPLQSSDLD